MPAKDVKAYVKRNKNYAIVEYIYDLADRYQEFKERQAKRAKAKEQAKKSADPF